MVKLAGICENRGWRFHKINGRTYSAELFTRKEPNVSSQCAAVLRVGEVGVGCGVIQGRCSRGRGLSHWALKPFDSRTAGQIWLLVSSPPLGIYCSFSFKCPEPTPVTFHSTFPTLCRPWMAKSLQGHQTWPALDADQLTLSRAATLWKTEIIKWCGDTLKQVVWPFI